jgi:hypothetical protein
MRQQLHDTQQQLQLVRQQHALAQAALEQVTGQNWQLRWALADVQAAQTPAQARLHAQVETQAQQIARLHAQLEEQRQVARRAGGPPGFSPAALAAQIETQGRRIRSLEEAQARMASALPDPPRCVCAAACPCGRWQHCDPPAGATSLLSSPASPTTPPAAERAGGTGRARAGGTGACAALRTPTPTAAAAAAAWAALAPRAPGLRLGQCAAEQRGSDGLAAPRPCAQRPAAHGGGGPGSAVAAGSTPAAGPAGGDSAADPNTAGRGDAVAAARPSGVPPPPAGGAHQSPAPQRARAPASGRPLQGDPPMDGTAPAPAAPRPSAQQPLLRQGGGPGSAVAAGAGPAAGQAGGGCGADLAVAGCGGAVAAARPARTAARDDDATTAAGGGVAPCPSCPRSAPRLGSCRGSAAAARGEPATGPAARRPAANPAAARSMDGLASAPNAAASGAASARTEAQGSGAPRPVCSSDQPSFSYDPEENFQRLLEHVVGDDDCPFASAVYDQFLRERQPRDGVWRDRTALQWLQAWKRAGGEQTAREQWRSQRVGEVGRGDGGAAAAPPQQRLLRKRTTMDPADCPAPRRRCLGSARTARSVPAWPGDPASQLPHGCARRRPRPRARGRTQSRRRHPRRGAATPNAMELLPQGAAAAAAQ